MSSAMNKSPLKGFQNFIKSALGLSQKSQSDIEMPANAKEEKENVRAELKDSK